jgi:hypothetical protein
MGDKGIAHWDYKDWADTVMDAWVLQLGVNAPSAFDAIPRMFTNAPSGLFGLSSPTRDEILGHFINIDDGKLKTTGKYFSPVGLEIEETAKRLLSPTSNKGMDLIIWLFMLTEDLIPRKLRPNALLNGRGRGFLMATAFITFI